MRISSPRWSSLAILAVLIVFLPAAHAKSKKPKAPAAAPQDAINVVGHIPLTSGPVNRFLTTQHYSSYYLYAEHDGSKNVTLIDVTKTDRPSVLADMSYAPDGGSDNLMVAAGTAALVSDQPAAATQAPQTIRIMDFSDPQNPKVARAFTGVTAMSRDDRRGLIYIADGDGIWILQQHLAMDPDVIKAYEDFIRYDR